MKYIGKQSIINAVTVYLCEKGYRPDEVVVSFGAATVLLGVRRTTNDIDLYVSKRIWDEHVNNGYEVTIKTDGIPTIQSTDTISIRSDESVIIDCLSNQHIQYQNSDAVLMEYQTLDRSKDNNIIKKLMLLNK